MFEYTREKIRQYLWDCRHHVARFPKERRKNILVVQMEGLGNAILSTPLIQALATLTPAREVDVLVNKKRGTEVVFEDWDLVNRIWDWQELQGTRKKIYYQAVLECHPRKDLPVNIKYRNRYRIALRNKAGLDYHWLFRKHEAEYLLDLGRRLGYAGPLPAIRRLPGCSDYDLDMPPNTVAIGIGYYKGLRADGRDWRDRHWGNENYLRLCRRLQEHGFHPVLVGDEKDFQADGCKLQQAGIASICGKLTLPQVVDYLGRCWAFIGNDTGLMHVAAAQGIRTIGIFVNTNSIKSYPLGSQCVALGGQHGPGLYEISVEQVWDSFTKLCNESKDLCQ